MQQKQTFSAQTLALSVTAAELGRAIFGAGQTGSVRAVLLSNVLAAAAFVLLAALASVNASRLNRPGFAGKCICAVFLLWYLFELVRTAAMLQQACWEQFASMAFIGLLPVAAEKLNFDPAVMASPLITTIVDTTTLLIYFNIARVLLKI